ncbi:MAG: flagellar biosynthesis anti-sigma factor FlgM [Gammaproteobacteria bacterium PRO9]|nr:flagellar biosynthesis anti-sigma factor FlgM [Gammaproteobacteria bacterium PRO9]
MANKITGYGNNHVDPAVSRARESQRSGRAASDQVDGGNRTAKTAPPAADSHVRLTDTATNLKQVEQRLASVPDVDQARVSAVRQRVESGNYQVNAGRLADRLLAFERDLA